MQLFSSPRDFARPLAALPRAVVAGVACCLLAACGGGGGGVDVPVVEPDSCIRLPDEITWTRSTQASADWNDVLVDARNRIWLAGYSEGTVGQERLDPGGNSRAVVRLLAPDGHLLWDSGARLDTPGTDVAEALAMTATGTVFVVGRTTQAFAGGRNGGGFDVFVAWAEDGADPWRTVMTGDARPQHPRRAVVAPGGELLVAGYDDEYIPSNYLEAWTDAFAMKFRHPGTGTDRDRLDAVWWHRFRTSEPDLVEGLAVGSDGSTYVSGMVGSGPARGAFVRKLDVQGAVLWTARYSAQATDEVRAVKVLANGELLIAGSVFGSFQGAAAYGGQDVFVARVDPVDGHVIERWQYGSAGADWLTDMTIDPQGRVILLGETDGSVVPDQAPAGLGDLFMLRLAANGTVIGRRQWGTADEERGQRVATDGCGRVVAVGSSTRSRVRAGVLWYWKP